VGSPLIGAQDPRDGAGDIGAVQTATLPSSAPAIVTTNKRPTVYAGPSFSVVDGSAMARLSGYAADDALPSGSLNVHWSVLSGVGNVEFSNQDQGVTTATFSSPGLYTLRLTADDGALTSVSDVQIGVGVNVAPRIGAQVAGPRPPSNVRILPDRLQDGR